MFDVPSVENGHEECELCSDHSLMVAEYRKYYNLLLKAVPRKYLLQLTRKITILNNLVEKILDLEKKRKHLIEKQIAFRAFSGEIHELYHQTTESITESIELYFSQYKSILNYVVSIVQTELRENKIPSRNIKFSSFGAFINSAKVAIKPLKSFMKTMSALSQEVQRIIDFRDNVVDHPIGNYGISTEDVDGELVVNYTPIKSADLDTKYIQTPEEISATVDFIGIEREDGRDVWHIHVIPHNLINENSQIKSGQYIGNAGIIDKKHFEKYGPHQHRFGSSSLKYPGDDERIKQIRFTTPSILDSYYTLCRFLANSLNHLNLIVKNSSKK